jgi:hypothetical protein
MRFSSFFGTPQNRHHFGFKNQNADKFWHHNKCRIMSLIVLRGSNKHVPREPWRIRSFFCCSFVFAKPFLLFFSCTANSVFPVCVFVVRLSFCVRLCVFCSHSHSLQCFLWQVFLRCDCKILLVALCVHIYIHFDRLSIFLSIPCRRGMRRHGRGVQVEQKLLKWCAGGAWFLVRGVESRRTTSCPPVAVLNHMPFRSERLLLKQVSNWAFAPMQDTRGVEWGAPNKSLILQQ